jgi:hypothetical protein
MAESLDYWQRRLLKQATYFPGPNPQIEDQVRSAQVARATFLLPKNHLFNPKRPSGFDLTLLGLFDSIEHNDVALIETRLLTLQALYQGRSLLFKLNWMRKLSTVHEALNRAVFTPQELARLGMRQLAANWRCLDDIATRTPSPLRWVGALEVQVPHQDLD